MVVFANHAELLTKSLNMLQKLGEVVFGDPNSELFVLLHDVQYRVKLGVELLDDCVVFVNAYLVLFLGDLGFVLVVDASLHDVLDLIVVNLPLLFLQQSLLDGDLILFELVTEV